MVKPFGRNIAVLLVGQDAPTFGHTRNAANSYLIAADLQKSDENAKKPVENVDFACENVRYSISLSTEIKSYS